MTAPRRARRAAERPTAGRGDVLASKMTTDTSAGNQSVSRQASGVWRLWFAVRYGPPRPSTVIVAGQQMRVKRRRLELPPGPNGSRGNPYGHAKWVKEWRQAGANAAIQHLMPPLDRVRISAVIHRRALGTADEDNDRARLKPLVDGLRDAGVIPKDTRDYIEWGGVTEERAAKPWEAGVLLIVEALERAAPGDGAGEDG